MGFWWDDTDPSKESSTTTTYDWAARYGPRWSAIAKATEKLQTVPTSEGALVQCAWCGELFDHHQTQVHHARYSRNGKLLRDDALPLHDVFAVCGGAEQSGTCHHALHQHPLWIEDPSDRVGGDRNSEAVLTRLQTNTQPFQQGEKSMSRLQQYKDRMKRKFESDGEGESLQETADSSVQAIAWMLLIGLCVALLVVAIINISPYVALATNLLQSVQLPIGDILSRLPFIGGMATGIRTLIGLLVVGILVWQAWSRGGGKAVMIILAFGAIAVLGGIQIAVGTFLWAVVQIFQCLWLIISMDKAAMKGALRKSSAIEAEFGSKRYRDHRDRSIVRKLKGIPYFFVRWAVLLAIGAYAFDAVVGIAMYPPAASLDAFVNAVSLGRWGTIDQGNLMKLLIMLFAFEGVLILVIVVWQWVQSHQQGQSSTQEA